MNVFDTAARVLFDGCNIAEQLELTHQAWRAAQASQLDCSARPAPRPIIETRFPERPPLRYPRDMPKRKLSNAEGLQAFFHALTHIEFMAIYLAWDIIYRFRQLPFAFYHDWLRIADEEAQHFALLRAHLQSLGIDYGDLPAHRSLWDVAETTADDLLARLALVPRSMEARGLDVTPGMIEKFTQAGDQKSVAILQRILHDEIGHVRCGSDWFRHFCTERGFDAERHFMKLVTERLHSRPKTTPNRALRRQAGFTETEVDWLIREMG